MLSLIAYLAAAVSSPAALGKPAIPTLPTLTVSDCNNERTRNQKLAQFSEDDSWSNSAEQFHGDWDAYARERMKKLGMSRTEQDNLLNGVADSEAFQSLQAKNEAILAKMGEDLETMGELESEAAACRVVSKMLDSLNPIMGNANQQWELVDAAIKAEAKRRGIKLD